MSIKWYFPRTTLAESLADGFTEIGRERVAMFANRQKGKTQFCLRDLMPVMKERGFLPVYIDFWSDKPDPAQAFAVGVVESYNQLPALERPHGLTDFKIKTPDLLGIGVTLGVAAQRPKLTLDAADEAIAHLLRYADHRPVFIVMDEIQHLATEPGFDPLLAKLRSFLVNRSVRCKHPIRTLFIGSDQARLADLFKSTSAPFYGATDVADFPDLGPSFTQFAAARFSDATQGLTLEGDAMDLFTRGGLLPGAFIDLLRNMASARQTSMTDAADEYGYFAGAEQGYLEHLRKLNAQDISMLVILANGTLQPYTTKSLKMLSVLANGSTADISNSSAQGTIRKLTRRSLVITKGHGQWALADSAMAAWIKASSQHIREILDAQTPS